MLSKKTKELQHKINDLNKGIDVLTSFKSSIESAISVKDLCSKLSIGIDEFNLLKSNNKKHTFESIILPSEKRDIFQKIETEYKRVFVSFGSKTKIKRKRSLNAHNSKLATSIKSKQDEINHLEGHSFESPFMFLEDIRIKRINFLSDEIKSLDRSIQTNQNWSHKPCDYSKNPRARLILTPIGGMKKQ